MFSHLICMMNSDVGISVIFYVRKVKFKEGKLPVKAKQWGNRELKPVFLQNKSKKKTKQVS